MSDLRLSDRRLRVGIAGARGIGRHQAKWFAQVGCEVVALFATTPESAQAAAEAVRALCDFHGRVEHTWDEFVSASDLDAVAVCSPPEAHAANVLSALQAGKHVLCEKPLVWDWRLEPDRLLAQAAECVATARASHRVLAMNGQYPAAVAPLLQLFREAHQRDPEFRSLLFRMETAGPPRSPHGAAEVWADLGPHPLAFLDRLFSGGAPDLNSVRREGDEREIILRLDWRWDGKPIPVTLELRRITDKAAVRREFVLDGWSTAYQSRTVDGEFRAVLSAPSSEWVGEDFMRTSVRRFVEAAAAADPSLALVGGEEALRQFQFQVAVWRRCFSSPEA
jgi:predicted dehydrogenase